MTKITYKLSNGHYHSKEFGLKEEINIAIKKLQESIEVIYYWLEETK